MTASDEAQEELVPDPAVARRYGVNLRTLPRWDADPDLNFPKPIKIRNRRYRRLQDLVVWERTRAAQS